MSTILAIDPGNTKTAFVHMDTEENILDKGILLNDDLIDLVKCYTYDTLAVEALQSYGMPVGKEVFETAYMIGRLIQVGKDQGCDYRLYTRVKVKSTITGMARAKDKDVRRALILRMGSEKKGGPLQGVVKDIWAALAVAVYCNDGAILGAW